MGRGLAAGLALVLVLSLPALGVPDAAPAISQPEAAAPSDPVSPSDINTSARLELPENDTVRSGAESTVIDAGATLHGESDRLETRYHEHRLEERLGAADSDEERRAILREELSRIDDEVSALRTRERTAYAAYANDDISERELLIEFARIHVAARELEGSLQDLDRRATAVPGITLSEEVATLESETTTLQGPVRERSARTLTGDAEPIRVHVETSENGVVLAMIDGDVYVREAYRSDNRDPLGDDQFNGELEEVLDRTTELYPWVSERSARHIGDEGAGLYYVIAHHPHGSLTVYYDGATRDVFREEQLLRPERMPTIVAANETDQGLEMSIERTYPGGPAKVTATDATSDDPVNASIRINGETVGDTGSDGELWFVAPRGVMSIGASVGPEMVSITLEWTAGSEGRMVLERTDEDVEEIDDQS